MIKNSFNLKIALGMRHNFVVWRGGAAVPDRLRSRAKRRNATTDSPAPGGARETP